MIEGSEDGAYAISPGRQRAPVDAADLDLADETAIAQAHAQLPSFAQRNLLQRYEQHTDGADIDQLYGRPCRALNLGALSYWRATRLAALRNGARMFSPGPRHMPKHIVDGHGIVNPFKPNEITPIASADPVLPHVSHLGFDLAGLAVERQSSGDASADGQRHHRLDKCPSRSHVSQTESLDCLEGSGQGTDDLKTPSNTPVAAYTPFHESPTLL